MGEAAITNERVIESLKKVIDPELGFTVVDLGLIYDVRLEESRVEVDMTFTSMGCPQGDHLYNDVKQAVSAIAGITSVDVNIVWDPPWSKDRVDPEIRFILGI